MNVFYALRHYIRGEGGGGWIGRREGRLRAFYILQNRTYILAPKKIVLLNHESNCNKNIHIDAVEWERVEKCQKKKHE